ncbi:MAG: heme A synthase [Actinomycetota bacterium]
MTTFRRLVFASTGATLLLVAIGGLVRASGSGLGCGDSWPDCSGHVIPDITNVHQMIEFSHRFMATAVVVLLGSLMVVALRNLRSRPPLMWPSVVAFGLVIWQAILGAIVVKVDLGAGAVVLHLATAMTLVAVLIYLSAAAYAAAGDRPIRSDGTLSKAATIGAAAVLILLMVGSYVSGKGAGNVFNDWPLMGGKVIPDLSVQLYALHFIHRVLAVIVGVVVAVICLRVIRKKDEFPLQAKLAHAAIGLFVFEIMLGAGNVWTNLNAAIVTLHLLTGALIFACVSAIAIVSHPRLAETVAERQSAAGLEPARAGR